MKFKCGKCGNVTKASFENIVSASTTHIIVNCSICQAENKIPRSANSNSLVSKEPGHINPTVIVNSIKHQQPKVQSNVTPGWIFVHDENTRRQSFDLKPGKNIIGRKSAAYADIPIETNDEYMSRRHCLIEVISNENGGFEFRLSDFKALNGTFINGLSRKRLRAEDIILLKDGDTIQLGMTKVVIRVNDSMASREQAQTEVHNSSYAPTVIVSKK